MAAAECDQLDLSNLAWVEMALRQAQTIEWAYIARLRDKDSNAKGGNGKGQQGLAREEVAASTGITRAGDIAMICPALLGHVEGATEKEASILKHIRQARQERAARKSGKSVEE